MLGCCLKAQQMGRLRPAAPCAPACDPLQAMESTQQQRDLPSRLTLLHLCCSAHHECYVSSPADRVRGYV